jgi:hypothetical protein
MQLIVNVCTTLRTKLLSQPAILQISPLASTQHQKLQNRDEVTFFFTNTNPSKPIVGKITTSTMLVQLSPWKTAQTSIRYSKTSKRRNRNDKDVTKEFPVEASFVTTTSRRGQQKMKQHSAEFSDSMPLLAVTSDHRITVVGRSKEPSYEEYAALQYSSRPGPAGSFFSAPLNGSKSSRDLPKIPAILDAKNDKVYALQNGNTRLCCWDSWHSSGPDEKKSLKVELAHPALSMSLLPMHKGIVYGTCQNGSIFIARVACESEGGEGIVVEYIPSKPPKGSEHVGTLAELPQGQQKTTGRKRKMSDADGKSSVVFYQAYSSGGSLSLLRHEVMCERFSADGKLVIEESLSQMTALVDLASHAGRPKSKVENARLLVSSSGTAPKVAVVYSIHEDSPLPTNGNSDHLPKVCCAVLSLSDGDISHSPVPLPVTSEQFGLVTETVLAVATRDSINLYDLETGSMLRTIKTADVIGNSTDCWLLCTDAKFGTLAILFPGKEHIQAAFSVVYLGESQGASMPNKLTLASKLSSALIMPSTNAPDVFNHLLKIGDESKSIRPTVRLQDSVRKAIFALDDARSKILSTGEGHSFMDVYESSVAAVLNNMTTCQTDSYGNAAQHNPQDALPSSEHGGADGVKKSLADQRLQKKQVNGIHPTSNVYMRAKTPSSLPQSFVDGAFRVVLDLLVCDKVENDDLASRIALACLDARLIMNRLLKTGKVSARSHFERTDSIQESKGEDFLTTVLRSVELANKKGKHACSPVDMIHEVLKKCPDVSERQTVAMLNYMLRSCLPGDIVKALMDAKELHMQHPYKKLCRDYLGVRTKSLQNKKQASVSDELDSLTQKVLIAGTTFILNRIVCYSECNSAMLRVALLEGLGTRQEALILARLLSDILSTNTRDIKSTVNIVKSTCQWVSALCDTFQDDLSDAQTSNGENHLKFLRRCVAAATKQSQAIISLKGDIKRAASRRDETLEKSVETPIEMKSFTAVEEILGYSIDHLVF